MAFDGIVTRGMARELKDTISEARIEKIYQPEKTELVFVVRNRKGRRKLCLSARSDGCGLYLTEESFRNPAMPPGFCMLLRKHLQGGIIREVRQKDWERIIELFITSFDELGDPVTYRMVCEIMGKHSNLVLLGPGDRILDAVKRITPDVNRVRQILPGLTYTYPPAQDKLAPDTVTPEALKERWEAAREDRDPSGRYLDAVQGISPVVARDLAARCGEDPERAAEEIRKLAEPALSPAVYLKEDRSPADFHIIPLPEYESVYRKLSFDNLSDAVSYYYTHRDGSNRLKQKAQDLSRQVAALTKKRLLKKQRLSEDLLAAEGGDKYRLYGELLTANLHAFRTGDPSVTVTNYYDGEPVTIPLDVRYAPAKNAQRYFKKYSKARNAVKEKQVQLEYVEEELSYLASVADLIERASEPEELDAIRRELADTGYVRPRKVKDRKGKEVLKPLVYQTSSGLTVLCGRNNRENDEITFKVAGRNDIWFHTKDIPGSHVILVCKNKDPDEASLREAASIAAFHSKARHSDNVPVDYTKVRYVKKPNGAKPGMVIFTDNRTLYVTPKLPT